MTRTSSNITRVEQINDDELHSVWGRARGEVANGQSEGLSIILLQYIYIPFTSMYLFGIINNN